MGPACARSRALPCGTPSRTSMRTTSPSSRTTVYRATEAPTLPAPTTVIFGRRVTTLSGSALPTCMRTLSELRHVLDDGGAKLRALHFSRSVHQACEVVGDHPGLDRLLQTRDDPIRRVGPSHVAQHHLAREDHRAGVDLVLPCVLRRGPVRRLEERVPGFVVDVRARRDADSADLRGERIRQEVAREVRRGDHVELVGPREDLLEEGVGDRVLQEDLARGGLAAAVVPRHGPVAELPLGQGVPPFHEQAFRVLLDVPLVDEGHVLPVVLDGVADRRADEPLGAFLRDRLDTDRGGLREADLLDAHLLLEEPDDLLGFRRPLLPLDAGVDVLRVLSENDHVHLVRPLDGRRDALEVLHGTKADVQIEHLPKGHAERAEPFTDGRRERALDGDEEFADDVERLVGKEVGWAVAAIHGLGLLPREDLGPRDLLPTPVRLLDGRVQHTHGRAPDVGAGAVALDERDHRIVRHPELPVVDRDLVALRNLDLPRHYGRSPWAAFSADPALNHAMCSSVRLWSASIVSVRPSGFRIVTVTGLPGASFARPVTLTRSCAPKRS